MTEFHWYLVFVVLFISGSAVAQESPRGAAKVETTRPARFPHRVWAACDFEAQEYDWFGPVVKEGVAEYPGNRAAMGSTTRFKNNAAITTGLNPVPGPMMGKENFLYLRYKLDGATEATFQHFSLSVNDNNHIRLSGLTEGKWSEATMNFTQHGRRNDGTPGVPFKEGERMDDLKIFVGKAGGGKCELLVDDIIFFANDPALPPEPEPFPRRVLYLAAFDTGIDPKSRPKYWPGQYDIVRPREAPAGSYWSVAKGVADDGSTGPVVRLQINPPRTAGPNTKLRVRYRVAETNSLTVTLHDATDKTPRKTVLAKPTLGEWKTHYIDFVQGAAAVPAGHVIDRIEFHAEPAAGGAAALFVDEVVLFDAYDQ